MKRVQGSEKREIQVLDGWASMGIHAPCVNGNPLVDELKRAPSTLVVGVMEERFKDEKQQQSFPIPVVYITYLVDT